MDTLGTGDGEAEDNGRKKVSNIFQSRSIVGLSFLLTQDDKLRFVLVFH